MAASAERAVMFNGLPIDSTGSFSAWDASELDQRWPSLPSALEGQFCVVRIDLEADRIEVLTDPLGIVQVFYGRRGEVTVVSSSASTVASILRLDALDPLAISSFLALGWAVERRSFNAGVAALPGGSVHEISADGIRSREHFGSSTTARRGASAAQRSNLAQQLVDLSAEAVRAGGPVRCALTAGRDTRVMAAVLRRSSVAATYYTAGEAESMDVVVARELAERFGLVHEPEDEIDPDDVSAAATSRFIRQNDGLASLVQLVDYIDLDRPVDELGITFWGVGGEIGRAGAGLLNNVAPNLPVGSRLVAVQRHLLRLKIDDVGLLTPSGRSLAAGFLDRFIDERRHEGWPTREISEAFYTFERVSSWGADGAASRRRKKRPDQSLLHEGIRRLLLLADARGAVPGGAASAAARGDRSGLPGGPIRVAVSGSASGAGRFSRIPPALGGGTHAPAPRRCRCRPGRGSTAVPRPLAPITDRTAREYGRGGTRDPVAADRPQPIHRVDALR